jgi:hypothetical protein
MQKQILSEQALYYDDVSMPKGFEINLEKLSKEVLQSKLLNEEYKFSIEWDKLNKYIIEFSRLKHNLNLENKKTFGNIYKPLSSTLPLSNINYDDLKNSPDFTMLYGVDISNCSVRIYYDDNRKKDRYRDIELKNNKFIMFSSINKYVISNFNNHKVNIIQTITYESK